MIPFPRFIGDVQNWIQQAVRISERNAFEADDDVRRYHYQDTPVSITWDATVALDLKIEPRNCFYCADVDANGTINLSNVGDSGRVITFVLTNDGTSGRTVTFGTGFQDSGNLSGTTSETATVQFIEAAGSLWEVARTTGLT